MALPSFGSHRDNRLSLSTTEAELKAACQTIKESVWLQQSIRELIDIVLPITMYVDNQAAIKMIENEIISARKKHLDISYKYLLETRKAHNISTQYISTDLQVADIMTKPLAKTRFSTMKNLIIWSLALMCVISVSGNQLLRQESSVIWKKTNKLILTGTKTWDLTIAIKSPCVKFYINDQLISTELYAMCQQQ